MSKEYDFKALERQLKLAISSLDNPDDTIKEAREELEKALHMLPRYERINEIVEQVRTALHNAHDFNIEFTAESVPVGSTKGWVDVALTGRKIITIELQR